MELVDLAVLSVILMAAALSAFLALYALSVIEWRRGRRDPGLFDSDQRAVVFLFEDEALVDATDSARQLLSVTPRDGSAWHRLVQALLPRFPTLGEEMSRLVDVGTLSLLSVDGQARLKAEWRQGLARINLVDVERQDAGVAVDRHSLAALEGELEVLRAITDRVPYLTWKEAADGKITWANSAYLDAAEAGVPAGPLRTWPPRPLFPAHNGEDSVRLALTLPGDRAETWFEVKLLAAGDDGALRLALPADALVRAEATQKAFVQTLTKTFGNLTVGLAIFDRTRRLALFNPALTDLTGLGVEFLAQRPRLQSFVDALREARMLPEPKNFETWRQRITELEAAAENGTFHETWTLPDGRVFQVTGRPHPDGAIAFLMEDVSAEVSLTRRFKAELMLSQAALDAMPEAVAAFSEDGLLAMSNTAYNQMWGVDPQSAVRRQTLSQALRDWRTDAPTTPDWAQLSDSLSQSTLRRPTGFTVERLTGRRMDCRFVPLPGGAILAGFSEAPGVEPPVFRHVGALAETKSA